MREIKFRAWDKDYNGMNEEYNGMSCQGEPDLETIGSFFFHITGLPKWEDRYVLMEYIGLKDKNGKEVYEGDVAKYNNTLYVVEWRDGKSRLGEHNDQWGMQMGWILNSKKIVGDYDSVERISQDMIIEVIGNVYENPELVEAKDGD